MPSFQSAFIDFFSTTVFSLAAFLSGLQFFEFFRSDKLQQPVAAGEDNLQSHMIEAEAVAEDEQDTDFIAS